MPNEIKEITNGRLDSEREKYPRVSLMGESMEYNDSSDRGIDDFESVRHFLDKIQQYIFTKILEEM